MVLLQVPRYLRVLGNHDHLPLIPNGIAERFHLSSQIVDPLNVGGSRRTKVQNSYSSDTAPMRDCLTMLVEIQRAPGVFGDHKNTP